MNNPSPLGIQLGNLNLNLTYNGTILGPATVNNFFLASGSIDLLLVVNFTLDIPIQTYFSPSLCIHRTKHSSHQSHPPLSTNRGGVRSDHRPPVKVCNPWARHVSFHVH